MWSIPVASLPTNSIQFINKDDCRLLFPGCSEQFTYTLRTWNATLETESTKRYIDTNPRPRIFLRTRNRMQRKMASNHLEQQCFDFRIRLTTPASPATARASIVFPVPGLPVSKMPFGNLPPRAVKLVGSCKPIRDDSVSRAYKLTFKKSTTSCNSSLASSTPWTSLNLTTLPSVGSNSEVREPDFSRFVCSRSNDITTMITIYR